MEWPFFPPISAFPAETRALPDEPPFAGSGILCATLFQDEAMKLLALALVLLLVPQDEKITLKFNPRKGDKLVKTQKLDLQLKFTISVGDQEQEHEFEQRGTIKRTNEYAEVEDGKVTKLVIDCAEDWEEKKEPPTMEWRRTDKPMHGRKVTLSTKDGQLVREGAEGLGEKELKGLTLNNVEGRFFPDKPVAVGETWEIKGEAVREFLGASEEIKEASLSAKGKGKMSLKGENDQFTMTGEGPITIETTNKID
jgi:hypothetical protein